MPISKRFGAAASRRSRARELTKIHEEFLRGTVAEVRSELAGRDRIRGEITLLIEVARANFLVGRAPGAANAHETIADRVARMTAESGVDEKEALKRLARELGRSKSELYRELQRERARKALKRFATPTRRRRSVC